MIWLIVGIISVGLLYVAFGFLSYTKVQLGGVGQAFPVQTEQNTINQIKKIMYGLTGIGCLFTVLMSILFLYHAFNPDDLDSTFMDTYGWTYIAGPFLVLIFFIIYIILRCIDLYVLQPLQTAKLPDAQPIPDWLLQFFGFILLWFVTMGIPLIMYFSKLDEVENEDSFWKGFTMLNCIVILFTINKGFENQIMQLVKGAINGLVGIFFTQKTPGRMGARTDGRGARQDRTRLRRDAQPIHENNNNPDNEEVY